jgi:hypothetical protein
MTIAFRAVGTTSKVASGNMTPGLPAGHALGDLLVLVTNQQDNVSCSVTGWTNIPGGTGNNGTNNRTEMWAKFDGGSESAPTVTHAAGGVSNAIIMAFSGVDSGLTVGVGAGACFRDVQKQTGNSQTTHTAPALTGVVSGDMRVFFGEFTVNDTSGLTTNNWGTVSGFTEQKDDTSSLAGAWASSFGIDTLLATGSAGSITSAVGWIGAFTSWQWQCSQIAISSDASGPPPPEPFGEILLEDGSGSYLLEDGSGVYLLEGDPTGNQYSISLQSALDFNNIVADWAPQSTSGFRTINGAAISMVDDTNSFTGRNLQCVSPNATDYEGWAIDNLPCTPGGNWRFGVWFKDSLVTGALYITELDFFDSGGSFLGNYLGWWSWHSTTTFAWAEAGGAAPANTHHATIQILHDHSAFTSHSAGIRFWNASADSPAKRVGKALTGVLSFAGAISKGKAALKSLTGALSFTGAASRQRTRQHFGVVDFNNLVTDFLPKSPTGWQSASSGTTTHHPTWQAKWPVDAGYEHAATATSALDTTAKLILSPKSAINALFPARGRMRFGASTASGTPVDLALVIYDASDTLLGYFSVPYGGTTDWDDAEIVAPYVLSGQAKASVGFRSSTSGVTAYGTVFGIDNETPTATGRVTAKSLSGSVGFAGALTRRAGHIMAGTLGFVGGLVKSTSHKMTGGLSFSGLTTFRKPMSLSGALSFSGAVGRTKVAFKSFTASVGFTGALSRIPARVMTAGLTFSGAINRQTRHFLTGSVSFVGSLARKAARNLSGNLGFTGATSKRSNKPLTANLDFTGAISKRTSRVFTAVLTFTGALSRLTRRTFTGGLTFSGNLIRRASRAFTASVGFTGAFVKRGTRFMTGTLSFSGAFNGFKIVGLLYTQALSGTLSFAGSLKERANKNFTGNLGFSGVITKLTKKTLAGGLSFAGAVHKRTTLRVFTATVSFAGTIKRSARRTFVGGLSFAGNVGKTRNKLMAASLSFSGALSTVFAYIQVQLAAIPNILNISHFNFRAIATRVWQDLAPAERYTNIPISNAPSNFVTIVVKGPQEVAYKRGTSILFEATFTDKDGVLYDPDVGTAKMYVKNVSVPAAPVYLTGYDRATGGKSMTKISTGVYQADWQSLLTDAVAPYEVEVEGFVGVKRSLDSVKVSVRA